MMPCRFLVCCVLVVRPLSAVSAEDDSPTPIRVTSSFGGDSARIESSIVAADGTSVPHGLQVSLGPEGRLQRLEVFDDGFLERREVFHDARQMIRQEFWKRSFDGRVEDGYELAWDANVPSATFAEGWRKEGRRWNGRFLVVEEVPVDFKLTVRVSRTTYRDGELLEIERVSFEQLGLSPEVAEDWARSLPEELRASEDQ